MTLVSELLTFRNALQMQLSALPEGLAEFIDTKSVNLKMVQINNFNSGFDDRIDQLISQYQSVNLAHQQIVTELEQLIAAVNDQIDIVADQQFNNAEYQANFAEKEEVLFPCMNDKLLNVIKVRIRQYCDWHYPGLHYNAKAKEWVDCMIISDPLYLTTETPEIAQDIISEYPQLYQSRLRLYNNTDIPMLPVGQFGFILCWNLLEYCSLSEIETYLTQWLPLLRAGGSVVFSYNNCDLVGSAEVAEKAKMNYGSARVIQKICDQLGYEVLALEDGETKNWDFPYISWAEIKKPGELTTTKAHQALGKILPK